MNPALQYQILNPATGQYVQIDGGQDSTTALLFNILLELEATNHYLRSIMLGQTPTDTTSMVQSDALLSSTYRIG